MIVSPPSNKAPDHPNYFNAPNFSLANIFNRLQPSPETVILILAVVIGTGTGLGVVLFHYLIATIHSLMLENLMGAIASLGPWTLACIPSLGGLIVGLMRWGWRDFGPSLSSLISATRSPDNVSPIRAAAKAIAAAVSLGAGASLGPEGPSVEIGASIGAILGQSLQVSQERLRLLLGAGAAAGLAAGFNAPIAGVFFALEVVLGTTFATSAVSLVLLSAVVSALISQMGLGGQPAFMLPAYEVRSPLELPLYLGLGLFASLVSIAYNWSIQFSQRFFQGQIAGFSWLEKVPIMLRPVIGGVFVGLIALQFPQALGIGYETVEAMLRDAHFSLALLAGLLAIKLMTTAMSLGSGLVGGLFAPAMFLGASLGAAYGKLLTVVLPIAADHIAAPPAYAMVGMAAVLAASTRAPLTAILLLFELTRDYRIILPLMAAVGFSVWLVDRFKPVTRAANTIQPTVLSTDLTQQNEFLHQIPVLHAMDKTFMTLPSSLSVMQAGTMLMGQQFRRALVVDEANQLTGIVTLQDINRAISRWRQPIPPIHGLPEISLTTQTLGDICTQDILYTYEDETLAEASARMATRGLRQLPVVDRENPHQVLGILDHERIALACSLAITQESLNSYLKTSPVSESVNLPMTTPAQ